MAKYKNKAKADANADTIVQKPPTDESAAADMAAGVQEGNEKLSSQKLEGSGSTSEMPSSSDCKRLPETEVKFFFNEKTFGKEGDREEYIRQLENQAKGMGRLTVAEYLANRARYNKEKRAKEGDAAQQKARAEAYDKKVRELRREGKSPEVAQQQAKEWLDTQAALHDPDQIAGGNPSKITGMGDKRINSSIGSEWRTRIKIIDEHVEKYAKNMTEEEKRNTYLNVRLVI